MDWRIYPWLTTGDLMGMVVSMQAGWQLVSLAMYGDVDDPRFVALFHEGRQRPWTVTQTFQSALDAQAMVLNAIPDDYYPTMVTATGSMSGEPRWRGLLVLEKYPGLPYLSQPTLVLGQSLGAKIGTDEAEVPLGPDNLLQKTGRSASSIDCFSVRLPPDHPFEQPTYKVKYCAVLWPSLGGRVFRTNLLDIERVGDQGSIPDTSTGLEAAAQHNAVKQGWVRAHHAVPHARSQGGKRKVFVDYRDDTYVPWNDDMLAHWDGGTPVLGPLKANQVNAALTHLSETGAFPLSVGANGVGSQRRFCITYSRTGKTKPKAVYFTVSSDVSPPAATARIAPQYVSPTAPPPPGSEAAILKQLDASIFAAMKGKGIRSVQIAVERNGRLKLARTYTMGELNYPIANNHHRFRIGSVSKTLTVMRLLAPDSIADRGMTLEDALELNVLPVHKVSAGYARFSQTTLEDLARYVAGWQEDNDKGSYPYLEHIFSATGRSLPVEPGSFKAFLEATDFSFAKKTPGPAPKQWAYNNFYFDALAEAISMRRTRKANQFIPIMQEFWGLGDDGSNTAYATIIPRDRLRSQLAGEVTLQAAFPKYFVPSVMGASDETNQLDGLGQPLTVAELLGYQGAPFVWGRDNPFKAGSGTWSMSMVTLMRILAGLRSDAPPPVVPLLPAETVDEWFESATLNAGGVDKQEQPFTDGMAIRVQDITLPRKPTFDNLSPVRTWQRMIKTGDVEGGECDAAHLRAPADGSTMSYAICTNCKASVGTAALVKAIGDMEGGGYWENDDNLFPEYFGA